MTGIISDSGALAQMCGELVRHAAIGLDTEFMRERTYFAQLCLLQLSFEGEVRCIDTLALPELAPLRNILSSASICKVLHAARQDLEVLWPLAGPVTGLYDTQVAAALAGFPAQIGYGELVRQVLAITLHKGQTRTDWTRRPLSGAQLDYALDDVRYLLPLRARLSERLEKLGRAGWFEEEMRQLDQPASFAVEPEQAWRRLKGLGELDAQRQELGRALAAWRERRAISADRPRSWILPDAALREMVLSAPRTPADLASIAELPEGIRNNSGPELLALIATLKLPAQLPPLPRRRRPEAAETDAVRKLSSITHAIGHELGIAPEILATRRQLERLVAGARDGGPLEGWRRTVVGERLLASL